MGILGKDTLRPAFAALGAAVVALWIGCSTVLAAEAIDVVIDFAKILKLNRPAGTIVIGNPGIADASMGDENTVVLTGKSAGTTNLIILDEADKEIVNAVVRVSSDVRQLTTIFYGSKRQTFSCAPHCEKVISVGDDKDAFESALGQIQRRQEFSGTAGTPAPAP